MKIDERRKRRLIDSIESSPRNYTYWQEKLGWKGKNSISTFVKNGRYLSPERVIALENAMREEGDLLEEDSVPTGLPGEEEELIKIISQLREIADIASNDGEEPYLRSFYVKKALESLLRKFSQTP